VADPPWQYGNPRGTKAGAGYVYDTMPLDAIKALPVVDMAEDDAHLWIWGTNMKLDWAYDVARAWGFDPTTLLTWCKSQPGVGAYLRNNTEHCLLAVRGNPITPPDKPTASYFIAPRTEHSAKPDSFYDLVEQVSPAPYVELFARRARFGWDYWGNQSLGTAELVA
jgi:N6-adenosine-specific RNA methylase IME4